jgi:CRP-like cAMP-binding protein
MSSGTDQRMENRLLSALPIEEYQLISPKLEHVSLALGEILFEPPDLIRNVYFPTSAIISFLAELPEGESVEVGLVGCDGLAGVDVFLGVDKASKVATVQGAGQAWKISREAFKEAFHQHQKFRQNLLLFAHAMMSQISVSVVCNVHHKIDGRLARWLLMYHDRLDTDEFFITHEFMANMLGIRRASVSEVAKQLQDEGLVDYNRGKFRILNREGLEARSCDCYSIVRDEFDRLYRN